MKSNLSQTAKQTEQNIMDAFWELYETKRIEKITVSQICTLAGYNRSTFYEYFSDVYEVLERIEMDIVSTEGFTKLVISNLTYKDDRRPIIEQLLQLFEENKRYFPVLLGEHGDPSFRHKLLNRLAPAIRTIFNYPMTPNDRLSYIFEYQSAAVLSIITKWYANGKDIPVEEFLQLIIDITTHGVQKELVRHAQGYTKG
ncbi:MAG TPA: TetR/AcrR family transcriptional regulator C-terminal domain-containing protein [Lachnospiraceae bacterium]|nr:TetR/AcrR family transcriptional regulator C-terminal domain-containing protein [Lachnospiraceae bacterium]